MRNISRVAPVGLLIWVSAACGEQIRLPAQGEVFADTLIVYALNGTALGVPTALAIRPLVVVRATGVFDYDIAFDINAAGQAVLFPMKLLAAEEAAVREVGLQKVDTPFEELTSAPRRGYVYDKPLIVGEGDVVAVEAATPCNYPYPQVVFGKLVIDDIDLERRAIHFRAVSDPSCGFRSLVPGELPRN